MNRYASVVAAFGMAMGCDSEASPAADSGSSTRDAGRVSDATVQRDAEQAGEDAKVQEVCSVDDVTTAGHDCAGFVSCGGSLAAPDVCDLATQACCLSGPPSESTTNCKDGVASCNAQEVEVICDGPEDCAKGKVCCSTVPVAGELTSICVDQTQCDDAGSEGFIFCHESSNCPEGMVCRPADSASFWAFCE